VRYLHTATEVTVSNARSDGSPRGRERSPIRVNAPCVGEAELAAVAEVLQSGWLGTGQRCQQFEEGLRGIAGTRHALAVSSGTAALQLSLEALSLRPGDEVIVPSLTYCATVHAILLAGGVPVFCEVDPDTLLVDLGDIERRLTCRTRAVVPVHFGGAACDMHRLVSWAHGHKVRVVADAAHAFGSTQEGRSVLALADATACSFGPLKNITCGDGGAVLTDDDSLAAHVASARQLGLSVDTFTREKGLATWHYEVRGSGHRMHMNDLAAAIGVAQLARRAELLARKQELVERYDAELADLPGMTPVTRPAPEVFPHLYVVRLPHDRRDALIEHLRRRQITAGVHYPPCHRQPAFRQYAQPLPTTERVCAEIVSLPMHAALTNAEQRRVLSACRAFCRQEARRDESIIPWPAQQSRRGRRAA
jgi:perosamine synthetase